MNTASRCVLAALSLALLLISGCGKGDEPLTFRIVFDDAKGLQPGQFVAYKGLRIGEVTRVVLDPGGSIVVDVKIKPEYRSTVYREAEFMIQKPDGLTDLSGEKQVVMSDRSGNRTIIQAGEVVKGTDGFFDHWLGKVQDVGGSVWDALKGVTGDVIEAAKGYASSKEGESVLKSMRQFMVDAKDLGAEQYQSLREKTLPDLQAKAQQLKDKMEHEGKADEAKKFWDEFTRWMKEADKTKPGN